jgi:hypothetical protein
MENYFMNRYEIFFGLLICAASVSSNAANSLAKNSSYTTTISASQTQTVPASAPIPPAAVSATIAIKRISKDDWELHYQFSEGIDALHYGVPVVNYRQEAWFPAGKSLKIISNANEEILQNAQGRFQEATIAIKSYQAFAHNQYVPMIHFSDGGVALFLGHLIGKVKVNGVDRPLNVQFKATGLPDEKIILPRKAQEGVSLFAYFGPQDPIIAKHGILVLDPLTPSWMREVLANTTELVTASYARSFERIPNEPAMIFFAIRDLHLKGYSMSGGALPGQLVYRLAGNQSIIDKPESRNRFTYLITHELAHIWQAIPNRNWSTFPDSWINEGGADAITAATLRKTGLWSHEEAEQFEVKLIKECDDTKDTVRIAYACGFKRFKSYNTDVLQLWKKLMDESTRTSLPYSETMIETVLKK